MTFIINLLVFAQFRISITRQDQQAHRISKCRDQLAASFSAPRPVQRFVLIIRVKTLSGLHRAGFFTRCVDGFDHLAHTANTSSSRLIFFNWTPPSGCPSVSSGL